LSLKTTEQVIKNYLRSVYDKTSVSDRLELALFTIHRRTLAEAGNRCRYPYAIECLRQSAMANIYPIVTSRIARLS
jgi:hypothetical protein